MAINKINDDIQSRQLTQGRVNEATSGKKEKVNNSQNEIKKANLEDKTIFSEDAKKLHETEVILQNALVKLHEMDELNQNNILGIQDKIEDDFYSNNEVLKKVVDDIFTDEELRAVIEKRKVAEKYVVELKKLDQETGIDTEKIAKIKERVNNGYYNSQEVIAQVANELFDIMDI